MARDQFDGSEKSPPALTFQTGGPAGSHGSTTGAVKRIHALAIRHKWEVFFITQRPYTDGETVQRHKWQASSS